MAEFFRKFPRFGGGNAIWTGDGPASVLLRTEFFGGAGVSIAPGVGAVSIAGLAPAVSGGGASVNPSTIMGAGEVDSYFDAAASDLFQNTAGTTPATADGDPVNFITGLEGPDFVASASSGRNAILRDPGGDPYLEAVPGSSQLRASVSRSGDLYVICRGRWNGTANDQEAFWTLTNNATQFYSGNFMAPRYFPFGFNYIQTETSVGYAVTTSAVAITRGVWSTLEIWVDGSTIYTAVDGGTPETYAASGPLGDTTLMDIFGSLDGGVTGSFAVDIRRLAVLNAIPDSTERAALVDWSENGDTGGGGGPDVDVAPGVGSVSISGLPPTVAAAVSASPGVGSVPIAGLAPTVVAGSSATVEPGVGAVTVAGIAPTVSAAATASVSVGSVAIAGLQPSVSAQAQVNPGVGSVAVSGLAPDVTAGAGVTVTPGVGSVSVAGLAPALAANSIIIPGVGSVGVSGLPPSVSAAVSIAPGVGAVSLDGIAPFVDVGMPDAGRRLSISAPLHPGKMMGA